MLIELQNISAAYGVTPVLHGVSLRADASTFLGLIGRNGAGKTTTLRSMVGLMPLAAGRVLFDGQPLAGRATHEIARLGVAYVPENRGVFPSLTVMESLTLAARPPANGATGWTLERVLDVFPRLGERRRNRSDALSGGEQQMLAIGRALLTNPRLLILDEPTEGLAPLIVHEIQAVLRSLRGSGMALIVVDQNLDTVFNVADEVAVMSRGAVVAQGPSATLRADQALLNHYLGV
ncbi:MAG: ABC transporter ATP-binding protein [Polaromonas sp.]|uniref:ABC transporter ATP-binding protein n=1 Tax=Polaromonas sp. TaxID=1869339 RepID=UPI00273133AD|nr:ABC transporter ATP-binding protein [Polaromonas sp.]MDP2034147.1 ABC transporter ATP-binding protein [Polaromonas sp.]MDP2451392.1 ABC transporter ATP-binding protein [Polaromonas sp.]MDP3828831.1 ABC transporter ATP-binding protein [Polaromonas sp.]